MIAVVWEHRWMIVAACFAVVTVCISVLHRWDRREAADRRLARTLAAAKYRPEHPDVADAYTKPERRTG